MDQFIHLSPGKFNNGVLAVVADASPAFCPIPTLQCHTRSKRLATSCKLCVGSNDTLCFESGPVAVLRK